MAHFAKLDSNNHVETVIVVSNDDCYDPRTGKEDESLGIAFCRNHIGEESSQWKQTSYNANFRGNYAGIGHTYMEGVRTLGVASTDVFIGVCTDPSWSIGINTATWYPPNPPGPMPSLTDSERAANKFYQWDEIKYNNDPNTAWDLRSN